MPQSKSLCIYMYIFIIFYQKFSSVALSSAQPFGVNDGVSTLAILHYDEQHATYTQSSPVNTNASRPTHAFPLY